MSARTIRSWRPAVSLRVPPRLVFVCIGLSLATVAAIVAGVAYGEFSLPLGEVLATIVGQGQPGESFVVLELRLPRVLVASLAGIALALSGVIFQTFGRNPLASPDIIGITGGAALFGVTTFVLGGSPGLAPVASFAGALTVSALMYLLAWRNGVSPYRLILIGVGLAAVAQAGISYVLIEGRVEEIQQAYTWLVGSVNLRNWSDFWPLAGCLVALIPVVCVLARSLDALALGDDAARALGVRVEPTRLALVVTGAALAATGVAAAGPIGFVAFVSPLIARRLTGLHGVAVMPAAALCGAALVPTADLLGRITFAPTEIPVGIVTSVIGAPVFLYMLYRSNRSRTIG